MCIRPIYRNCLNLFANNPQLTLTDCVLTAYCKARFSSLDRAFYGEDGVGSASEMALKLNQGGIEGGIELAARCGHRVSWYALVMVRTTGLAVLREGHETSKQQRAVPRPSNWRDTACV